MTRRARTALIALAGLSAALALALLALSLRGGAATEATPVRGTAPPAEVGLPAFALRTPEGTRVGSTDLEGRAAVVTFLDTQCTDACPLIGAHLRAALDELAPSEREGLAAVAISVHPSGDTPERVRGYLARHRLAGDLSYLVGTEAELRAAWSAFEVLSSHESGRHDLHSAPVRVYDARGRLISTLRAGQDLSAANLAHDVRVALS